MEPQPEKSSNPNEKWYPCFEAHGISSRYYEKWLHNYIATTDEQQEVLQIVREGYELKIPMVFLGKFGNGKTHIASAFVKNMLMRHKDAFYYTFSNLFREYRLSLRSDEFTEAHFFKRINNCDLLVIDEFNIRSNSESETRIIQEIIDKRYANEKQTIFIANMDEAEFAEVITERLLSRLREQGAEIIVFNWKDYRSKND